MEVTGHCILIEHAFKKHIWQQMTLLRAQVLIEEGSGPSQQRMHHNALRDIPRGNVLIERTCLEKHGVHVCHARCVQPRIEILRLNQYASLHTACLLITLNVSHNGTLLLKESAPRNIAHIFVTLLVFHSDRS